MTILRLCQILVNRLAMVKPSITFRLMTGQCNIRDSAWRLALCLSTEIGPLIQNFTPVLTGQRQLDWFSESGLPWNRSSDGSIHQSSLGRGNLTSLGDLWTSSGSLWTSSGSPRTSSGRADKAVLMWFPSQ
ncbi:hypothetical protein M8J77_016340 [Diaphorina citri]|nr:hypothetical protein M8J77_016340 [Diaphorina citri]